MLDRCGFPRDKPCGDGIAPEAFDVLAAIGFDTPSLTAGFPPVDRLLLRSPDGSEAHRRMPRPARVIPRAVFDARLVEDVTARGAVLRRHTVRSVRLDGDVVLVDGLSASVVVGADGAESRLRRAFAGTRAGSPMALAIRGYAAELPEQRGSQLIVMSGRHWPAYAWSFPLGDGRANVGYGELLGDRPVTRTDLVTRLPHLLSGVGDVSTCAPTGCRCRRAGRGSRAAGCCSRVTRCP